MEFIRYSGFEKIPAEDLYEVLKLRQDIFIIEQTCIYDDIDGRDAQSHHLLLKKSDSLAAYSRIVPPGEKFDNVSIGRIVVHKKFRGRGLGKKIVIESIKWIREMGYDQVVIEAQAHLQKFYGELGFEATSEIYDEDGIPHLQMTRNL